MRREKTGKRKEKLLLGVFAFLLAVTFGLSGAFVSYASQAKVTARSANIRKEASTGSDKVGGVKQGDVVDIVGTVKGTDGKDWYQVSFNGLSGYIRSDLVTLTEGSVPPEGNGGAGNEPPADVRPLNPVSATVSRDSGRIRSTPSVSGEIVSEVPNGLVLTVTGDVTDADGSLWYQVNYNSGETPVNGYIRSDYVTLAADTTPVTDTPPEAPEPTQEPVPEDKPYDTILYEGEWHLMVNATNEAYNIEDLFASVDTANSNAALYEEVAKSEKNQKVIIIILVFLLVAAVAGIAFLVFKIKDMMDAAYFSEVENDALRKRKAANQGGSQRVMHSVDSEVPQGRAGGARQTGMPQGQRSQGAGQRAQSGMSQGQRMQGSGQSQRMQGSRQDQRMQGSGQSQRMQSTGQDQRMQGSGQGQRMQSTGQDQRMQGSGQGQRMQGSGQDQRIQGSGQGQRMQGSGQGQRMQGSVQGQRMQGSGQGQRMQGYGQGQRLQESGQDQRMQGYGQSQRMQESNQDQRMQRSGQRVSGDMQFDRRVQEQRQNTQGQRSMGAPQGARPVPSGQEDARRAQRRNDDQGWQSRNFMADEEEEFDLEFLNYDEEQ